MEPYERIGDVPNVVFPTGTFHDAATDTLRVYYGAADSCIGVATATLEDLLSLTSRNALSPADPPVAAPAGIAAACAG